MGSDREFDRPQEGTDEEQLWYRAGIMEGDDGGVVVVHGGARTGGVRRRSMVSSRQEAVAVPGHRGYEFLEWKGRGGGGKVEVGEEVE